MISEKAKKLAEIMYSYVSASVWCEECSTESHPIAMTQTEGVFFVCPLCKKTVMVIVDIKNNVGTHYGSACPRCQELEKKGIKFGREN